MMEFVILIEGKFSPSLLISFHVMAH